MRKMVVRLIGLLCVVLFTLITLTTASADELKLNEEELKEVVKQVIKENPQLIYDTLNEYAREQKKRQQEQALEASFKDRVEDVISDDNPAKGPEKAPITIIEYTDFQCPYCTRGAQTLDSVMEMYPDKVRAVFKNNPLKFHDQALPAAKAALAAHKQGKFWEYQDLLFENSQKLNEAMFQKIANDLDLDLKRFEKDRNSEEIAKQIQSEQAQAAKLKLTGTPAFLVNGVPIRGAYPPEYFAKIIDRLLGEGV